MQARHEFKHSLNFGDYVVLRDRLRRVLSRDAHTDENGEYRVRSLYFDTPRDKALREKVDGVDRREKFRIRRYVGGGEQIKLEKKSKIHGLCYKRTCPLNEDEVMSVLRGDFEFMARDDRELLRELYCKTRGELLAPKTVVEYIREPFVHIAGNVRITLDRDIRTGLFAKDFLSDGLPTVKAGDEMVLLEVKYDQFLPEYIAKLIKVSNRRASACSKYAISRIYG